MNKFLLKISLHIVLLFAMSMFLSLVPDYLRDFFGDWVCQGRYIDVPEHVDQEHRILATYTGCDYDWKGEHSPKYHWGFRHWLWCFMSISLFVVQAVRIFTIKLEDK